MSVIKKIFGVEIKRKGKSAPSETPVEKPKTPKEIKEAKREDAKRRWEYDMRRIRVALNELGEGGDFETILAELNSDPLLSKPVDAEMLRRLADHQRHLGQ